MTKAQLPMPVAEADMIETVAHWLDLAADLLRTENSRRVIRSRLKALIRRGTIPAVRVIEWANQGIVDADEALREVAAEMLDHGETIPATIRAYTAGALLKDRGPHGKESGRAEVATNNWLRDNCIAIVVAVAIERWSPHLRPFRNPASHRPCACSVVSAALGLRGVNMTEHGVKAIYKKFADLLVQHQAWLASNAA